MLTEREPLRLKGCYFSTEAVGDGDVRICWSETDEDQSKWDPLDFWTVPAGAVEETIAQLREGVTL